MTSKLSWIFFIPFTAAAVFFKLARVLFVDGFIFGLSDMMLDYAAVGCVAAVFLFALIMCLVDRKIAPYYLPHRNIAAGIFGLLAAVAFAADGADRIYDILSAGNIDALEITEAVLMLLTAIVFVVLGLTHSFRNRDTRNLALFNVIPALMFAIKMVKTFVAFTTVSITAADVSLLVCYIFATLFFFNYAVALSLTEAKNAVKSCFIFGFPAVAAMLMYGVAQAYSSFDVINIFGNLYFVELLVTAVYILAFLIELTVNAKDRDHVVVVKDEDEPADTPAGDDEEVDESFVVTGIDDEERTDVASSYLTTADTDGYLYQETKNPDEENGTYSRSHVDESDGYITSAEKYDEESAEETPMSYGGNRLDEIDKLILEISGELE